MVDQSCSAMLLKFLSDAICKLSALLFGSVLESRKVDDGDRHVWESAVSGRQSIKKY